ncbi:MAG: imidazole glycerol phosphate synthase subunit HisH [Chloroflexi bacterium]|nr:imidazole glycerol phosphate synthase subunit HisH [Anaerolineaceae bacterium]NMB89729.1 imidazole glycerol phosphate synthase subunit HisH [Chloroflexota bacterium]
MESYDALLIDAGTGNLQSVHNALLNLGVRIRISSAAEDLEQPNRIILPGVGAFRAFMDGMRQRGLVEPVCAAVRRGDPLLGICVGMQAFFQVGEEMGTHAGLGLLPGKVQRFPEFKELKVPQTGWNELHFPSASPLFSELPEGAYAYFNHSYYCVPADPSDIIATTDYGLEYACAVQRNNLFGVQFHPEKSQRVGQKILSNFVHL